MLRELFRVWVFMHMHKHLSVAPTLGKKPHELHRSFTQCGVAKFSKGGKKKRKEFRRLKTYVYMYVIASLCFSGWLYDTLGSYAPGFYVAGGTISLSGLILFLIPMIERRQKRRWDENTAMEQIQQEEWRGLRRDYPLIVLNSPSTPSSAASTEDTYSNRVYKTTIIDEKNNFSVNDDEDTYDFVNIDAMNECDERFDDNHRTHSIVAVSACEISKQLVLRKKVQYKSFL